MSYTAGSHQGAACSIAPVYQSELLSHASGRATPTSSTSARTIAVTTPGRRVTSDRTRPEITASRTTTRSSPLATAESEEEDEPRSVDGDVRDSSQEGDTDGTVQTQAGTQTRQGHVRDTSGTRQGHVRDTSGTRLWFSSCYM